MRRVLVGDIIVKANEGDIVVANEDFNWNMSRRINKGEEWKVVGIDDLFVHLLHDGTQLWLGKNSFVRIFDGATE